MCISKSVSPPEADWTGGMSSLCTEDIPYAWRRAHLNALNSHCGSSWVICVVTTKQLHIWSSCIDMNHHCGIRNAVMMEAGRIKRRTAFEAFSSFLPSVSWSPSVAMLCISKSILLFEGDWADGMSPLSTEDLPYGWRRVHVNALSTHIVEAIGITVW